MKSLPSRIIIEGVFLLSLEVKKTYSAVVHPVCPTCGELLEFEEQGYWFCDPCTYTEYNNLTHCQGEWCENNPILLSKDGKFSSFEERFCSEEEANGYSCLKQAYGEQSQFVQESQMLEEHQRHCSNDDCDCRNT